ncbi:phosphatidate cytidylyltransferase [Yimella sp. cx-573]|nr:phosphatidate cytidylyltransferase [Yimella sp. cx-573]
MPDSADATPDQQPLVEAPVTRRSARADAPAAVAHNPTPRAGRNLYAAIGVGVFLGALVLASLFVRKEAFVVIATAAAVVGTWELLRAMGQGDIAPPVIPTLAGAAVIPPVAFAFGPEAFAAAVGLTFVGILLWRSVTHVRDSAIDVAGGLFTTLYVPTLVSFAMLLTRPEDGPLRIVAFIVTTIASDIGGYAVGVVFGKHPMAPTVSPKKSWEGFAGSAVSCVLAGALTVHFLLDGRWWIGALMGCCVVVAATVGDLCESMIKRDLGIKDMSNLIPGHGGLMDRLDSLVIAAPVSWAILTPFVMVS